MWTSSVFVPYSSAYSTLTVSAGSLPSFRTGTKPAIELVGHGALKMNPRDSMPTTRSIPLRHGTGSVSRSITSWNASRSFSSVVMS